MASEEPPTKLNQLSVRWLVLTLQCLALIGSYWCYDNPTAVENQLKEYFNITANSSHHDTSQFNFNYNMLYTVYSVPNTVLPFFGGYFCDKLGIRMMALIFSALIAGGQFIFAVGLTLHDESLRWPVMWIGRVIFGFGGESLSVAQSAMIAKWFVGKELAFALGMNLALARVGSVINDVVSVRVAAKYEVYDALWVGFIVCLVSLAATTWCFFVDKVAEKKIAKNLEAKGRLTGDEFAPEKEEINLGSVRSFPLIFWILTLSCLTVYCTVLPFNNIASGFITQKWLAHGTKISDLSKSRKNKLFEKANNIMLVTYLTAGVLSPLMGGIIDRVGYRAVLNVVASVLIVGVHLTLRFTTVYPVFPLLVLGLCYSIYAAALWPSIALVVNKDHTATAYGVVTAVQNLGLALAPLAIGLMMPPSGCGGTYNCVEMFFVFLGAAGSVSGIALNLEDRRRAIPVLNLPEAKIAKLIDEGGGDLAELERRRKLGDVEATQGLLAGDQTPTLYDNTGGTISIDERRSARQAANGDSHSRALSSDRPRSGSADLSGSVNSRH